MSVISHVVKTGHRCKNPLKYVRAGYIKAGEHLQLGNWGLFYLPRTKAYAVFNTRTSVSRTGQVTDYYEFHNFNCAAAKLAELGAVK